MPTYTGYFPLVAQGHAVTVTLDGVSLTSPAPGNVGSTVRYGSLPYSYEYAGGDDNTTLLATVSTSAGLLTAWLELDNSASIAAGGGGVGASETAYFVATGPTLTTDAFAGAQSVTMEADSRHGDLPAWASVIDGTIALGSDAGTCAVAADSAISADFSSASGVPTTGGFVAVQTDLIDGYALSEQILTPGNGEDIQGAGTTVIGLLVFPGEVPVKLRIVADVDGSTNIADGVVTPKVAVTVTRLAQSPVLPS